MRASGKQRVLARLRAQLSGVEGQGERSSAAFSLLGNAPDFPMLVKGALHEVRGRGYGDRPAALGFLLALVARLKESVGDTRPLLWCEQASSTLDFGTLYGPGLASFGLDPARFIVVRTSGASELLWAMEEGVRSGALSAVVGAFGSRASLDLTASRRLQLASERTGTTCFLLRQPSDSPATVARSRWIIATRMSGMAGNSCHNRGGSTVFSDPNFFSDRESNHLSQESTQFVTRLDSMGVTESLVGLPRWQVEMEKCQGASGSKRHTSRPGTWEMEWDYAAHCFRLVSALVNRPVLPQHGADRGQSAADGPAADGPAGQHAIFKGQRSKAQSVA